MATSVSVNTDNIRKAYREGNTETQKELRNLFPGLDLGGAGPVKAVVTAAVGGGFNIHVNKEASYILGRMMGLNVTLPPLCADKSTTYNSTRPIEQRITENRLYQLMNQIHEGLNMAGLWKQP